MNSKQTEQKECCSIHAAEPAVVLTF